MKLLSDAPSKLIVNMGASWYKEFEKEFSKDYFQKVSSNIEMRGKTHTIWIFYS